jgi:hypothetical protein
MELRCASCGLTHISPYYFRAPSLCTVCFRKLPVSEKQRVAQEHPAAPWQPALDDVEPAVSRSYTVLVGFTGVLYLLGLSLSVVGGLATETASDAIGTAMLPALCALGTLVLGVVWLAILVRRSPHLSRADRLARLVFSIGALPYVLLLGYLFDAVAPAFRTAR